MHMYSCLETLETPNAKNNCWLGLENSRNAVTFWFWSLCLGSLLLPFFIVFGCLIFFLFLARERARSSWHLVYVSVLLFIFGNNFKQNLHKLLNICETELQQQREEEKKTVHCFSATDNWRFSVYVQRNARSLLFAISPIRFTYNKIGCNYVDKMMLLLLVVFWFRLLFTSFFCVIVLSICLKVLCVARDDVSLYMVLLWAADAHRTPKRKLMIE